MGCHMKCKTGYHESPAEKPVTCCQSVSSEPSLWPAGRLPRLDADRMSMPAQQGYRSNSSGTCAKSTDGKL